MEEETVLLYGMYFMKLNSYEWTEEKRLFPLIGSGAFPPFSNSPPPDESKVGETDFFFSPHFFHSLLPAGKKLSLPSFAILNFRLQSREKGKTGRKAEGKVFPSPPFSILAILRSQERKTEKSKNNFPPFRLVSFTCICFFVGRLGPPPGHRDRRRLALLPGHDGAEHGGGGQEGEGEGHHGGGKVSGKCPL